MKQFFSTLALVATFLCNPDYIYAQQCPGHPLFTNMANFEVASCDTKEFDKITFTILDKAKGTSTQVEKTGEFLEVSFKVFIVGHTDNTGDFQHNIALSKQRATAVVSELTAKYAVPATQLTADGVGSLSPVGSNANEESKARNRRVEMVQK
ncbi:OmpA family protein [Chitinophaga sp. S165]|uniref:OmpA family protein n=1 Tax=Chitinophaga sp. S165 TaxID=2135462 RepID=UPI000D70CC01|nr:OmpA family protein [Chitinophaga sp. S165]PWV51965.1 OmpA family protein [Chitinophaga sp. S165]